MDIIVIECYESFSRFSLLDSTFLKLKPVVTTVRLQDVGASIIALDRREPQPFHAQNIMRLKVLQFIDW